MKICKHCTKEKEITDFYPNQETHDGLRPECKSCVNVDNRERYKNNPDMQERQRMLARQWYHSNRERVRKNQLLLKFNITELDYDRIYQIQGGKCAICGKHQSELKKTLCVDHDHKTHEVRGLLCHNCNSALGYLNDNSAIAERCIVYLKKRQ